MLIHRNGNKEKIASEIYKHFPPHKIYIEPFFGAGGMFFLKPKAKYNYLNDIDNEIVNVFNCIKDQKETLINRIIETPVHETILKKWVNNFENDQIGAAVRFLYLSNMTMFSKGYCLKTGSNNAKENILKQIEIYNNTLANTIFANRDYKSFLNMYQFRHKENERSKTLIYADPPYLGTDNNYKNSFTKKNHIELQQTLIDTGCMFAISEFLNDFVVKEAEKNNLNIIEIITRRVISTRKTEILITNFQTIKTLF